MAATVCEEYASSLNDLTFNSKPHISMLTMLAEENIKHAPEIVQVIEAHLHKVKPEAKLPAIYLIDSIVKNVGATYQSLFTQNLVSTFCNVFSKVDEKTRIQLFKLRQTWSEVFPNKKLYAIDVKVNQIDPAWPITAQANIHVNPKFLKSPTEGDVSKNYTDQEAEMKKQLIAKQQELLKIQQQKLELELLQTKARMEEQKRLIQHQQQEKKQPLVPPKPQEIIQKPDPSSIMTMQRLPPVPTESMPQPRMLSAVSKVSEKDPRMARDPRLHTRAALHVNPSSSKILSPVNIVNSNKISNTLITNNKIEKNVKDKIESEKESNLSKPILYGKEKSVPNIIQKSVDKKKVEKKDNKKKSEPSLNKKNENKKDEKIDKHKSFINDNKKSKSKSDKSNTETQRGRKTDKTSGRNSGKKIEHRKPNNAYRSGFRNQRNYRNNRDRSESPESKFDKSLKTEDKDQEKDKKFTDAEKKINVRGRSRSPIHSERPNEKEDKRVEKSERKVTEKDKNEHRKKSPRKELDKNKSEHNTEKESSKENKPNCKELSTTDIDLRVPQTSGSKLNSTPDTSNTEKDENSSADEPPPSKKMKRDDEDASLDDLFGTKDQDYRQLPLSNERAGLLSRSPGQGGWAQYKTDHPDKFRNAVTPLKESNSRNYSSFGNFDQDFRKIPQPNDYDEGQGTPMDNGMKFSRMQLDGRDPRLFRSNDPRVARTFGKPWHVNKLLEDPRLLRRHPRYQRFQSEMKGTDELNIPRALLLNRQPEILKQAEQQLKSGHLTREQHAEFLNQLATLYELQRLKEQQREEQFRERLFKQEYQDPVTQRHYVDYPDDRPYDTNFPSVSYNVRFNKEKFDDDDSLTGRDRVFKRNESDKIKTSIQHMDDERFSQESNQQQVQDRLPENHNVNEPSSSKDSGKEISEKYSETKNSHNRSEVLKKTEKILIDGRMMELKYVDTRAIVLDGKNAKEIYFKGGTHEVTIDELNISLAFGEEKCFEIDGISHSIRFGVPRRELYINKVPYEIRFGGPPVEIKLNNKMHHVRVNGPLPEVELKELDELLKKEIVNDDDSKNNASGLDVDNPEKSDITISMPSRSHTSSNMEISDSQLDKTNLPVSNESKESEARQYSPHRQDDRDYRSSYGFKDDARYKDDLMQRDLHYPRDEWKDHWRENIYNEEDHLGDRMSNETKMRNSPDMPSRDEFAPEYWPRRPMYRERSRLPNPQRIVGEYNPRHEGPPREIPYRDHPMHRYRAVPGPRIRYEGHHPVLYEGMRPRFEPMRPRHDSMVMRPRMDRVGHIRGPVYYTPNNADFYCGNYPQRPEFYGPARERPAVPAQPVVSEPASVSEQKVVPASSTPPQTTTTQAVVPPLDINELFQKLVTAGIIGSSSQTSSQETEGAKSETSNKDKPESTELVEEEEEDDDEDKIPSLEFTSECLRMHYSGVIAQLYRGIQCSSCGLRFTAEQTEKYAQHLDWHFRHNRRERDSAKKAVSRKWYYDVQDWIQFEEIEDLEDRARSLFEVQAVEVQAEQVEDVSSVPVGGEEEDNFCIVCREPFEQFWDEEKEEWHLRDAMRVEDKTYHPACYEDIRNASLQESSTEEVEGEKDGAIKDGKAVPSTSSIETSMETEGTDPSTNATLEGGKIKSEEPNCVIGDAQENADITMESEIKDALMKESENIQPAEIVKEVKIEPLSELDNTNEQSLQELEKNVERLNVQSKCENSELESNLPQLSNVVKTEPVDQVSESESAHLVIVNEEIIHSEHDPLVKIKEEPIEEEKPLCSQIMDSGCFEKGEIECKSNVKNLDVDKLNDLNVSQVDTIHPIKIENTGITEKCENKDIVSMSDSRFTVLPPVQRGTELSGLCTIL